jgi:cache domain-containing protein
MANRRYELDTRVLTVFFLAAMPFVALGSFFVVSMARTELRSSVGGSLEQRALQTKLTIERYVADQVVHLRLLASDPQVVQALLKTSPAPAPDRMHALEQAWASGQDLKQVAPILDSSLSARLRQVASLRPALKSLQVIGARGDVVAATSRSGHLNHAESAWYKTLASQAENDPWIGDIQRVANTTATVLEIASPVRNVDGEWLGAVRTLVDGSDLYGVLAPVRVGRTGRAILVRSTDGMLLASDESEQTLQQAMPGWASLQSAIAGFPLAESGQALFGKTSQHRGYWAIPEIIGKTESGREGVLQPGRLVGFAPVDQVPNVKWLVAVEQDQAEALAPVDGVTRYLWVHFVGVFLAVILLAVYFSFKLETPVMEEELHIHEEHVPSSMRPSVS